MTLRRTEAFARNATAEPQTIVHPGLSQLMVIPVAPGGYTFVTNQKAVIEPGQYFRVPMVLWNQGRAICKLRWAQEVSEEEFRSALNRSNVSEVSKGAPAIRNPKLASAKTAKPTVKAATSTPKTTAKRKPATK